MSEPLRHDYTRKTYEGGWAIVGFEFVDVGKAKVRAFGLKRQMPHQKLEEAYLSPGEEMVISMPDGEVLYEITTIHYHRDPYDMYEAEVKYVQHLTGLPIVAQLFNEKQSARQIRSKNVNTLPKGSAIAMSRSPHDCSVRPGRACLYFFARSDAL